MNDFEPQQVQNGMDIDHTKKEKDECVMCKFVLIFSFIALLLVLALIFFMKVPAVGSVGF